MRRSFRRLVALAVMVLVAGLLVSTTTTSASAGGSISYVYSRSTQTFNALPSGSGGGDAGAYEYKYQDECVGMADGGSPFEVYPDDGHTCQVMAQQGTAQCPTPGVAATATWLGVGRREPAGQGCG